jgi:hypothetical protein
MITSIINSRQRRSGLSSNQSFENGILKHSFAVLFLVVSSTGKPAQQAQSYEVLKQPAAKGPLDSMTKEDVYWMPYLISPGTTSRPTK